MGKDIIFPAVAGQVGAVTGGGGELCGAMAEAMASWGMRVAVLDVDPAKAEARVERIQAAGGEAMAAGVDVLSRHELAAVCERIKEKWGGLHVLINGAGGNHPQATTSDSQPFFALPLEAIRKVFELNFLGTFLASQVLGELILETVEREGSSGQIVNISSMNAFRPLTRIPAYSAAKAAVSNFTQWLAVHLAQNYTPRIRVNAIAPGFFLTEQNRFLLLDKETGGMTERGRRIREHTPAGELGRAEDLLSTLAWLLDPGSRLVTGVVVPVDGGFSAFSGV